MNALLIIRDSHSPFDKRSVIDAIQSVADAYVSSDSEIVGDVTYGGDRTLIRFGSDPSVINIAGMGKASIYAAIEIGKYLDGALRITNYGYEFDIRLDTCRSVAELNTKIDEAYSQ